MTSLLLLVNPLSKEGDKYNLLLGSLNKRYCKVNASSVCFNRSQRMKLFFLSEDKPIYLGLISP